MKRLLFVLLGISSAAFAQGGGEWFQVTGGSWVPDAATLSIAGRKLRSALESRLGGKVSETQWRRYSFQYQGTFTSQGQRAIHLNAFCEDLLALVGKEWQSKYDFTGHWLHAGGGGSCFFSANYDVAHGSVTDLEVNPSK